MRSTINIYTETGKRLDLYPNATIEINMGGTSIFNLQERKRTYSNSFNLPRTPNNEKIFEFASSTARNNRPSLKVTVQKGLFFQTATLKVDTFSKDYNCTLSFDEDGIFEMLKTATVKDLYNNLRIGTTMTLAFDSEYPYFIQDDSQLGDSYGVYNLHGLSNYVIGNKSIGISIASFLDRVTEVFGITFTGSLLSETDFQNGFVYLPDTTITDEYVLTNEVDVFNFFLTATSEILVSDIIKEIALFFFAEIKISKMNIDFSAVIGTDNVSLNGFSEVTKKLYTNLGAVNRINYTLNKNYADKNSAGDYFTSTGSDDKEVVKLKSYLLASDGSGYYDQTSANAENAGNFAICTSVNDGEKILSYLTFDRTIFNSKKMAYYNLSGYYSNVLNPIMTNPVILDVSIQFDGLKSQQIEQKRRILSEQLNGEYFVEQMAYNQTTGQSKMTLIKL